MDVFFLRLESDRIMAPRPHPLTLCYLRRSACGQREFEEPAGATTIINPWGRAAAKNSCSSFYYLFLKVIMLFYIMRLNDERSRAKCIANN